MNKLLIVGLGNPGQEYAGTRHSIGFDVLDAFSRSLNTGFESSRLADVAEGKIKNKMFILIKPTTFMNLSGKAVNYYLQRDKIPLTNLLVITDDLALPVGQIRMRSKGGDGGHNGLKSINEVLGSDQYARLRFGIGNDFPRGAQSDFVLGRWTPEEKILITPRIDLAVEAVKDFGLMGVEKAMNAYNNK